MIKEEYNYRDVAQFLDGNIHMLIAGFPNKEERSSFFSNKWIKGNRDVLFLQREDNDKLRYLFVQNQNIVSEAVIDLCFSTSSLLQELRVDEKNILIDISSLDNVLIMFITKQLLSKVTPHLLFAAYIRPERYSTQSGNVGFSLSDKVHAIEAVPGFAKREKEKQILCTFLGFEGIRLKGVLETIHSIDKLIPIVAFPSGAPEWYNVTMLNSMDMLQSVEKNLEVYKCLSESIFDAVELLKENISQEETVVLAPLGTRPHSMACAIFACQHQATRILYDFVVENEHRAIGISDITIYHLSNFIKT